MKYPGIQWLIGLATRREAGGGGKCYGCLRGGASSGRVSPPVVSSFDFMGGQGGTTTPREMIILRASSTLISSSIMSSWGTINRKPEVGLGVVGTNTLTMCPGIFALTSPRLSL